MPFNSLNFGYFFLVFYTVYLLLQKLNRIQNLWLLAGSYIFYAAWDWRFLLVLLGITASNYIFGLSLGKHDAGWLAKPVTRRLLLGAGLFCNLGTLVFFKYAGYFKAGLVHMLGGTGFPVDTILVDIILPVGLSFYTLQASSYLLDVSARRIQPTRNLLDLALFIGFFPQLLAGPIERAGRMLPQFHNSRKVDPGSVSAGIYLLLSGFFKKLVVADNLGVIANTIFDNYSSYAGIDLVIGGLAFTFQLYADFSAYSDIARGLARLMGFELMVNFRLPYFSATPAEFWSRWHISLSEWLRDYIFFPIRRALLRWKSRAGSMVGLLLPPLVTMLVSGIWHGTGWNFILWGLYHGILMVLFQVLAKGRTPNPAGNVDASGFAELRRAFTWLRLRLGAGLQILFMFVLVAFGWLIFRVETLDQLGYFLSTNLLATSPETADLLTNLLLYSLPVVVVQIIQQARGELLVLARLPFGLRIMVYGAALALMVVLAVRQSSEFIYVQF
jgi:alginate O-acetyltransferase complex protein AlgI